MTVEEFHSTRLMNIYQVVTGEIFTDIFRWPSFTLFHLMQNWLVVFGLTFFEGCSPCRCFDEIHESEFVFDLSALLFTVPCL
jgi:hypothetical protein